VQWGTNYQASPAYGNATGLAFPNTIGVGGGIIKQNPTSQALPLAGGVGSSGSNYIVNLPAAVGTGAGGAIGFTFGNLTNSFLLDLQLSAMEQTGEGKIISSPKVTTLDNTTAKIQQGLSIPYQTVSQMGTQTQFIDAVLSLEVTPHITANGSIIMKIKADKNAPDTSILSASGVPSISKKEADTEVLVKNGETTVIGGIYQFNKSTTVSGVPWFYKIPLIGWLFKNTTRTNQTTELLIFITPRIVNQ
jgi:type IV pilus assembly protein PilQ